MADNRRRSGMSNEKKLIVDDEKDSLRLTFQDNEL
jgi:hypothetical protein